MARSTIRKIAALALVAMSLVGSAACSHPRITPPAETTSAQTTTNPRTLANGLYAVVEEMPIVVFDTSSYVPLILAARPNIEDDPNGHPLLEVTLADQYVKLLEDFTRAHVGGKVAIVLGGELVTMHKLRAVITGGRMKITRCTDRACETILSKLLVDGGA